MKLKLNPCYSFEAWQIPHDKDSELTREIPRWIIDMMRDDELILISPDDKNLSKVKTYYGYIPANQGDYIIKATCGFAEYIFVCPEAARKKVFIEITNG